MRPLPAITLLVLGLCTSAVVRAQVLGPSPGPFGENNQNNIGSSLWETSDTQILTPGNGRPPAWRSRYDPVYKRSYIAPAIAENHCKGKCSGMPGMTYPYEEYILDPTANSTALAEPVIRVWYPKGSWAPASPFPGGTLFFMYPYKSDPTKDLANPLSTVSAALEYEVYFPIDFDFNKGQWA